MQFYFQNSLQTFAKHSPEGGSKASSAQQPAIMLGQQFRGATNGKLGKTAFTRESEPKEVRPENSAG